MKSTASSTQAKDGGFTLLEMLAVMCLIALAFTVVTPRFGSMRQSMTLRATAVELASNLKIARAAARASNTETVFVIAPSGRRYAAAGSVKPTQIPRDVGFRFAANEAVAGSASSGGFRFRPDGTASGGGIELRSGAAVAMISVDWLTGAVTLHVR